MGYKYDLHLHSDLSDGDYPVNAVIAMAIKDGMSAIAITDHDSWGNLEKNPKRSRRRGLEIIPGLEISARWLETEVHILGYAEKFRIPVLKQGLKKTIAGSNNRVRLMIKKLEALGFSGLNFIRLKKSKPRGGRLTKYDIVKALTANNKISQTNAHKLVNNGGAASVPYGSWAMDPMAAISLIRRAGGIAVLAHPEETAAKFRKKYGRGQGQKIFADIFSRLVKNGLGGIECRCFKHDAAAAKKYSALARRHGLLLSGGSDWHGEIHHPEIPFGQNWLNRKNFLEFKKAMKKPA